MTPLLKPFKNRREAINKARRKKEIGCSVAGKLWIIVSESNGEIRVESECRNRPKLHL